MERNPSREETLSGGKEGTEQTLFAGGQGLFPILAIDVGKGILPKDFLDCISSHDGDPPGNKTKMNVKDKIQAQKTRLCPFVYHDLFFVYLICTILYNI